MKVWQMWKERAEKAGWELAEIKAEIKAEFGRLGHPLAPNESIVEKIRNLAAMVRSYAEMVRGQEKRIETLEAKIISGMVICKELGDFLSEDITDEGCGAEKVKRDGQKSERENSISGNGGRGFEGERGGEKGSVENGEEGVKDRE